MRVTIDNQETLIAWAENVIGCKFRPDAKAIGNLRKDGEIAAVAVYDGFSECDCNIHIASDGSRRWMTKSFLAEGFSYPFVQLGLRRVTGLVPKKNLTALKINRHFGYEIEGICKHALPDDDIVIMGMLRSQCRFIPEKYRND